MKKWQLKEKNDEKTFRGKRNRGSGNKWWNPGDVKSGMYLIECKSTTKNSYSLSWKTLDKIYSEALFSYRIPLLSLEISPPHKDKKEVVIVFREDWKKISKTDIFPDK